CALPIFTRRCTRYWRSLRFAARNYETRLGDSVCAAGVWRDQGPSRTCAFWATSKIGFSQGRARCRSARKTRAARFYRGAERISRGGGRHFFHPGARGVATNGLGPRPLLASASHTVATAFRFVLGRGGLAHGVERERGGAERSEAVAPGVAGEGGTRVLRDRQRFFGARDPK